MLKRCIYLLLLMVSPLLAFSNDDAAALFKKGNGQYQKAHYKEAAAIYQKLVDEGYHSTALYFNLGNSYYKTGDIAPAILYYEKARKLSPGDEDIKVNIQFASSKTADKVEEIPEFFITKWWHGFILALPADTLAVISVLLVLAGFGLLILYRFTGSVTVKKTSFYAALIMLIFGAGVAFIAGRQQRYFDAHHEAIIFTPSVTVKSAPSANSKNVFVLHEGTRISVLENNNNWIKIRLVNGNEGWITSGDAREI